ncbi:hypothetical protein [Estrella lausannensis]|uniref:Conserved putative membrane protein n=1 Tax=Estrella lausannensis TaxID=483423 RepID=A0A0H5DRN5_9BACT|nr:hypothetical protein [Estrella lausannensis]CRX38374.1 Conserved putative membrane protein [Estrella lausannensis]
MQPATQRTHTPIEEPPLPVTFWEKVKDIGWKVWEAVKAIFYLLAGVALFIANPSLFAIGAATGVIFDEKVKEIAEKISVIYNSQQWKVLTLTAIGAFFSLPVTAGALAIGFGAHLGYSLLPEKEEVRSPV